MRPFKLISKVSIALSVFCFSSAFAVTDSPIGYWKTIDDISGKPKSIVQISQTADNSLVGKVVKIFPSPGKTEGELCNACRGDKQNQPIVGMVIITGLKGHAEQWKHGEILDPENGRTYSCSLRVAKHGNELDVHGYIGMPMLGRTQTWERIDLMDGKG